MDREEYYWGLRQGWDGCSALSGDRGEFDVSMASCKTDVTQGISIGVNTVLQ